MSECWSARRVEERRGTIGDGLPGYMRVASPLDGVGSQNYHKLFLKSTLFYREKYRVGVISSHRCGGKG